MEMNNETKKFSFLKYIIGAVVVLVFAIVLAFNYSLKNTYVYAATYNEICDGFSFSVSGSSAESSTGSNLSVTATGSAGGACSSASAKTSTITITNTFPQAGTLNFSYTLDLKNGTITLDGTSVTQAGNYSKKISSGEKITITVKSAAAGTSTIFNMTNILSQFDINANITFDVADEGGSYTVSYGDINDDEIVELKTETINAVNPITFTALPLTGYKIYYWEINGHEEYYLSSTFSQAFTENTTIKPVFCEENAAIFTTKAGGYFKSLNEANDHARSASGNGKIIVPFSNDTVIPAGNYEISKGVTLLIPFDAANTVYTTTPGRLDSYSTPTIYKKLTLKNGVTINVTGELCVCSKLSAYGTGSNSRNGTPSGPGGRIMMEDNSNIILESGSSLYCWGFISGNLNESTGLCSGQITAMSGSTVYEAFQNRSWRGGTASSNMIGRTDVFPFPAYYVQNIECSLKILKGATEKLYTYVNTSLLSPGAAATFISSSNDGLFRISDSDSSAYIIKRYNYKKDILEAICDSDVILSSINIGISGYEVNSGDYILPLNAVSIRIISGNTISIGQDLAFIPDSKLIIDEGGTLDVTDGKNIYVYDVDDWGSFAGSNQKIIPVGYTVANGTTAKRTASTLKDAEIVINGLLQVSGGLYTTSGGANIHSEITYNNSEPNNGVIKFNNSPGTKTTTKQATQDNTSISYTSIPITSAKLKNGSSYENTDDEFFETSIANSGVRFVFQAQYNENYEKLGIEYNKWGIFDGIILHTISYTDGTITINKQFRELAEYIFMDYPDPEDQSADIYEFDNTYRIKGWIINYNDIQYFFLVGKVESSLPFNDDVIATVFYG